MSNRKHPIPDIPSLGEEYSPRKNSVKIKDVEYTAEEAIEDLRALSESFPERRMTRDFYRKHANIPESAWTGLFGTFAEFVRASGLEISRYENRVRLRAAQHASQDKLRKLNEEKRQYGNRYDRTKYQGRSRVVIGASDLHDQWCDPFYLRVLVETIRMMEPDDVCLAGDIFDCPEFGRFNVDPPSFHIRS